MILELNRKLFPRLQQYQLHCDRHQDKRLDTDIKIPIDDFKINLNKQ